jgi:hypothetical protein
VLEHIEALLARQPPMSVPTIVLDGADDGVSAVPPIAARLRHHKEHARGTLTER